jgi:two-component system, OmpR family, response regulator RegX3
MNAGAPRILVVDDEESITQFVSYNLKKEGYDVSVARDGDSALALAEKQRFDLVVLDIMLPGIDGFEVCRRLRAKDDMPVLFLSARDTELDKVIGLEIGADDYLAKPFGIRELQARVKALLRRATGGGGRHDEDEDLGERMEAGGFVVDEGAHTVTYEDRPIELTPREFELLACLMRHRGNVLSREQLLKQAWGWQIVVETKTVDTHVKRLRDKLEEAGASPEVVETVRGYGYRLAV